MQSYEQIEFEDISNLQIPVLLINGELSQDHYHQTMQKMHIYLPNSKLVVLKNSGHMLSLENPNTGTNTYLDWLIGKLPKSGNYIKIWEYRYETLH